MLIYFVIYLVIVLPALFGWKVPPSRINYVSLFVVLLLLLFVGFRRNVGGDWVAYHGILELAYGTSLSAGLRIVEPGYSFINWIGSNKFGGIYFPNFFCALVAIIPLFIFCHNRANPWLSLVVATPYLIIVVYMGYTRQSAAIGICMLAILSLERERFWSATGFVMLAGLFHLTAAGFFLPIIALSSLPLDGKNMLRAASLVLVSAVYLVIVSGGRLGFLFGAYISTLDVKAVSLQSAGAVPRLGLGVLAGAFYIWLMRKQSPLSPGNGIWMLSAIGGFVLLPLALLTSTFADRAGLYLIPLQLHVASLADIELKSFAAQQTFRVVVIGLCGAMLAVWLMRSRFAEYWLPYDNLLFHLF